MTVERDNKGKTIATPYHPEELRWEGEDCISNSTRDETIPDPWLERSTERKTKTTKNNFNFEQVGICSSSGVEDETPKTSSDKREILENVIKKDTEIVCDDFPNGEFVNTDETLNSFDSSAEILDTAEDVDLPNFDENAQQPLWDNLLKTDSNLQRAKRKASIISDMLTVKNSQEQNAAVNYLTEIFRKQSHQATFHAIIRIAMKEIPFTELKTIIELRNAWAERPDWWLHRHDGKILRIPRGQNALTWKLADQICQVQWQFPPENMIEESWLEEWLHIEPEMEGYWSFPAFIKEKTKHKDAEILYEGLQKSTF